MAISTNSLPKAERFFENEDYVKAGYLTVKNRGNAIKPCDESTLQNIANHFYNRYGYQSYLLSYGNMTRFILYTFKYPPSGTQTVPINKIMRDGLERDITFDVYVYEHLTEGDGLENITDGKLDWFFSSIGLKRCKEIWRVLEATHNDKIKYELAPFCIIRNTKFSRLEEFEAFLPRFENQDYWDPVVAVPLFGNSDLEYLVIAANNPELVEEHLGYYNAVLGKLHTTDNLDIIYHGRHCEGYYNDVVQFKAEGWWLWFMEMFYRRYFGSRIHFKMRTPRYFHCYPPELFYKIELSWTALSSYKGVDTDRLAKFVEAHLGLLDIVPARDIWVVYRYGTPSIELIIRPRNWELDTPEKRAEFEAMIENASTKLSVPDTDVITKSFVDEE